jgi:NAD(P)-dependent dehydrogenase (short-subunit alcohol dehydrogenase family)
MTVTNTISLRGQVAVVTGGARGIGLAIAEHLACAGAKVALVDIAEDVLRAACGELTAAGHESLPIIADVSQAAQVEAAVQDIVKAWGRIDILVNNAGICPVTPVEQITEAEWDRVLAINLKGTFLFCQAVMPVMRGQHSGRIINMSSSAGQTGGLIAGLHYSSSKAAIIGMTRSLARYLAPEITVNAVAPGMIDTDMTRVFDAGNTAATLRQMPLHRLGAGSDVAWAVMYLASEGAGFLTGQTLGVSGGLYMG